MITTWTTTQKQRLNELHAEPVVLDKNFATVRERDQYFQSLEKDLVQKNKDKLLKLKTSHFRPLICRLETRLIDRLTELGFVQVTTPIIISKSMLDKMTVTSDHPLSKQVFWLDKNKCLRPMLAPNLYFLLKDLGRLWDKPVRIFEIGPCFRKESQGAHHLNEFTMLNLVEMGVPEGSQKERLRELIQNIMDAAEIKNFSLETEDSEVYGETIDVVSEDLELGSAAFGPHALDENWGIFDTWAGVGFGIERLAMVVEGHRNIRRVGRSLSYLDGSRLNI